MDFVDFFNTTTFSNLMDTMNQLKHVRKIKMRKFVEKAPPCSKDIAKGAILKCVESSMESLIETRKSATPASSNFMSP